MTEQSPNASFTPRPSWTARMPITSTSLPARYAADPAVGRCRLGRVLPRAGRQRDRRQARRRRAQSWARADWPPQPVDDLTAALTGEWPLPRRRKTPRPPAHEDRRQGRRRRRRPDRRPDPARRARLHPRHHDHPRLPHPRPPRRRPRPAGHADRDSHPELDPALLRLHRSRHGPADLHRQRAGPSARLDAPDPRHREAHLLRHLRAAIHAHLRPRTGRPGSRNGSKATARRSPSPARAARPS